MKHQDQFHSYANGITRFGLRKADIGLVEIPLPPLPEQRRIAHILGTLDEKIELIRRMNQTLEQMARAIFQDWFVDFGPTRAKLAGREPYLPPELWSLFPDRLVQTQLGEAPEGWGVRALGEVCTLRAGSVFPKASQGQSQGVYPFIKVSDMNLPENSVAILGATNWVEAEDLPQIKAKPFPASTTVFAKIGEALKHNRFRLLQMPTIIDNNMMGAIPDTNAIEPLLLFNALSRFDMGEIAGGSALPYLTVRDLSSIMLPAPPLSQQATMSQPLQAIYAKLIANGHESLTLAAQRGFVVAGVGWWGGQGGYS